VIVIGCFVACGGRGRKDDERAHDHEREHDQLNEPAETLEGFCARCHELPKAEGLPREAWAELIPSMYAHAKQKGVVAPLSVEEAIARYTARAPVALEYPPARDAVSARRFVRSERYAMRGGFAAAVTHFVRTEEGAVFVNDSAGGGLYRSKGGKRPLKLAQLSYPARFAAGDVDGDGALDLVATELGALIDIHQARGGARLLRGAGASFEPMTLLRDAGRVADASIADVDGDGRTDVVLGVFGLPSAQVAWLRNASGTGASTQLETRALDERVGAVDVEVADLDGDGAPEVLAVLSQELEVMMAYDVARGGAPHTLARGGDPGWGSTGMVVADLDGDGDRDIVWIVGDMLDAMTVRPHHGLHLLDNRGSFRFERTQLAFMPGAHAAAVGDMDGDGDRDIVAAAALPWRTASARPLRGPTDRATLIWLEQRDGQFIEHAIEHGQPVHTAIQLADADADSDLDIFVSELNPSALAADASAPSRPWLSVFLNQAQP
jgi:hypothetical protein